MACVAPKNGSAAGERQSTSSRRPVGVGEPESAHVHGLGVVGADHAPQAQVEAEAAQGAQSTAQASGLQVAIHRLLAQADGCPAHGLETVGHVGDRLFEASRDGREMQFIAGDQRRVGLGGEAVWQVEHAGGQGCSSGCRELGRPVCARTGALRQGPLGPIS